MHSQITPDPICNAGVEGVVWLCETTSIIIVNSIIHYLTLYRCVFICSINTTASFSVVSSYSSNSIFYMHYSPNLTNLSMTYSFSQ